MRGEQAGKKKEADVKKEEMMRAIEIGLFTT